MTTVWREILEPNADNQLNQAWLECRIQDMLGSEKEKFEHKGFSWGYDQLVTTFGLLKHKFCTVPAISGLWKLPGLKERGIYFPSMNESNICWHGKYYNDCNKDRRMIPFGCKWWHFHPYENFETHVKKFNKLTDYMYKGAVSELKNMFIDKRWNKNWILANNM